MHNSQKCIFPLQYWLERLEVLFRCSTFPFLETTKISTINVMVTWKMANTKSIFGLKETILIFWFKSRRLTICWQKLTRWSYYNCCYSNIRYLCTMPNASSLSIVLWCLHRESLDFPHTVLDSQLFIWHCVYVLKIKGINLTSRIICISTLLGFGTCFINEQKIIQWEFCNLLF